MTDPISFSATSPRFGLPLLFAGQSQKEITVNEAVLCADTLLHPAVEGLAATVPAAPSAGQCWIVGSGGTGVFAGQTDRIAAWSEGGWRFLAPRDGLRAYDISASAHRIYAGGEWRLAAAPPAPSGGTVIDSQARTAIAAIIAALRNAGIIS
ncbi:MAG: DUF2793 domain-containing protein [Novosphingobium sp.]